MHGFTNQKAKIFKDTKVITLNILDSVFSYIFFNVEAVVCNTGYTQKNGAVSEANKKFISHLTLAQRTPSAAATKFLLRYQQFVSHAYCGASFQDGVAAGKGFLCAPF